MRPQVVSRRIMSYLIMPYHIMSFDKNARTSTVAYLIQACFVFEEMLYKMLLQLAHTSDMHEGATQ